jgi:hypothetical protein
MRVDEVHAFSMARKGSVTAASVLERMLRAQAEEPPVDDELERILRPY